MQFVTKNDPVIDFETYFNDLDIGEQEDIKLALQKFERNLMVVLRKLNVGLDVFQLEESEGGPQESFKFLEVPIASNPSDQPEIEQFARGVAMAFKE